MKIAISGSTGFIGSSLRQYLTDNNNEIIALTRDLFFPENQNSLMQILEQSDVVINLAGASIGKRWSHRYKQTLVKSRIKTTNAIVDAINKLKKKPRLFISASAVGYYSSEGIYTENDAVKGEGFLSDLCENWEKEASRISSDVRLVITRFGVVLSNNGGAFPKLALSARMGVATISGSGKQAFSWISLLDLLRAFNFIINHNNVLGLVNLTSGELITNADLASKLKAYYHSFLKIKIPQWVFKIILGEAAEFVLKGQYVIPQKLIDSGFIFENKTIESFLEGNKSNS